jgi:hypothetical protein
MPLFLSPRCRFDFSLPRKKRAASLPRIKVPENTRVNGQLKEHTAFPSPRAWKSMPKINSKEVHKRA